MWRALRSPGLSSLGHTRRATQRNEAAILQRKNKRWPTLKEGWAEGRTIVFIYESALTERHTRVKTRAPKGQAQMMHYQIICKRLSLLADATVARFLSGFFHGAIELPRLDELIAALTRQIQGKLHFVWAGLPARRRRMVRHRVDSLDLHTALERPRSYALQSNTVAHLFGYAK